MVVTDNNLAELAKEAKSQSDLYLKQLILWLALGSGAGAIAMVSLATQLDDPDYALRFLAPSLWCFLAGVLGAGAGLLFLSKTLAKFAEHLAHASNRASLDNAIAQHPERAAAPRALWEQLNAERLRLISQREEEHRQAERYWTRRSIWRALWLVSMGVSAAGFVAGFAWPLVQITRGHGLIP